MGHMKQNIYNTIYGLAVVDASARPYEFINDQKTLARLANYDYLNPGEQLRISDDTQMSIYLIEAFFDWKNAPAPRKSLFGRRNQPSENSFITHVGYRFLTWRADPRNNRAPGNACMHALNTLHDELMRDPDFIHDAAGLSAWGKQVTPNSMGSGTVMRTPWLGILHYEGVVSYDTLKDMCVDSSYLTHGHAGAILPSFLAALLTSEFLSHGYKGKDETFDFIDAFIQRHPSEELSQMLTTLRDIPDEWFTSQDHEHTDISGYFPLWTGPDVLGSAIAILCATQHDAVAFMKRNLINNQDSDTVGAVAGAFMGACSNDPHLWGELPHSLEPDYTQELNSVLAKLDSMQ